MTPRCNNQAAIHITNDPIFHDRTKHVKVDYHFIIEKIQSKVIGSTCPISLEGTKQ